MQQGWLAKLRVIQLEKKGKDKELYLTVDLSICDCDSDPDDMDRTPNDESPRCATYW
jgi:hypothetical protein